MEFDTEFIQFTSLEPSIYRLKEPLNLHKFGLWLSSVRTKVSLVRTVFCDRVWKGILKFLEFLQDVRTLLSFHPDIQVVSFFLSFPTTPISSQSDTWAESYDKNTKTCAEIFLEAWNASGRYCPLVRTTAVSRSVSELEIQLRVETGEAWPSVRTV
jgi:hypothetical protein